MKRKKRIVNNIKEFVDKLGLADTLGGIGKAVYKGTACGPWLAFPVKGRDRDLYYENDEAWKKQSLELPITGVKVGSIVEGSDVEIGPEYLEFPFDIENFWSVVEYVNKAACSEWERANQEENRDD